jgi:threonine dehydratase
MSSVSRDDVERAAQRIGGHVRRTPVVRVTLGGIAMWLKLEQLQLTGSFKARGATNALLQLRGSDASRVVAASGGNHGLGVAHAARAAGLEAVVVVPSTVPPAKADLLAALGATVLRRGDEYAEAEAAARAIAVADDVPFVHPFEDPQVIAGQGTLALEVLGDLQEACDAIVVAVGGGGLLAGTCLAAGGAVPLWGVEPEGIPTMHAALRDGRPVDVAVDSIAASSLGARATSPLNLSIVRDAGARMTLVGDEQILSAQRLLWDECRIVVEPGGAAALAAVLAGQVDAASPCVVLCGANTAVSF